MNISDNKRVVALSACLFAAFAATAYYGYITSSEASETRDKIKQIEQAYQGYNNEEFPPVKSSEESLKAATAKIKVEGDKLSADFEQFKKTCWASQAGITPTGVQEKLRKDIEILGQEAKAKGVRFANPAVDLGHGQFKNTAPGAADAPYRAFMLAAVTEVADILVQAGTPSIEKIYCAPLPEAANPTTRRAAAYFPLSFQVAFMAKRGTLPQVLNALVKDKNFFYTVTGVSVLSDVVPPAADEYREQSALDALVSGVESDEEDENTASAASTAQAVAVQKMGREDELVRVHLTLQVLYFNSPNK